MSFEYPLIRNLLMWLDVDKVNDQVRVLPNYEYNPTPKVISVSLYSKSKNYLESLVRGFYSQLRRQLMISTHQLPNPLFPSNSSAIFFPTVSLIHEIKIASIDIKELCEKFGLDYNYIYSECEPKPNLPHYFVRR